MPAIMPLTPSITPMGDSQQQYRLYGNPRTAPTPTRLLFHGPFPHDASQDDAT